MPPGSVRELLKVRRSFTPNARSKSRKVRRSLGRCTFASWCFERGCAHRRTITDVAAGLYRAVIPRLFVTKQSAARASVLGGKEGLTLLLR